MTEVTLVHKGAAFHRCASTVRSVAVQQFASEAEQKQSKRLIIFTSLGETVRFMASAHHRFFRRPLKWRFNPTPTFWTVWMLASLFALSAGLVGQAPSSPPSNQNSSSSSTSSSGPSQSQVPASQLPISQVQTSLQNPVFGSVPDAKPIPGVLALTFIEAINRALRQNLAGLLSEYNTIEARGEKWEQLSDLLPNINADVQEVVQKTSLEALGLRSKLFPRAIGPFSYFDVRASATQRL